MPLKSAEEVNASMRKLKAEGKLKTLAPLAACPRCGGPMLATADNYSVQTDVAGFCPPCKYPSDVSPLPCRPWSDLGFGRSAGASWSMKTFLNFGEGVKAMYEECVLTSVSDGNKAIAGLERLIRGLDARPPGRPPKLKGDEQLARFKREIKHRPLTVEAAAEYFGVSGKTIQRRLKDFGLSLRPPLSRESDRRKFKDDVEGPQKKRWSKISSTTAAKLSKPMRAELANLGARHGLTAEQAHRALCEYEESRGKLTPSRRSP
jgi:hypothetical protein